MEIKTGRLPTLKNEGLALDIGETLSYTIGFWVAEMQKLYGNPENLSIEDMIKKYRYVQNIPYWQTKEALEWAESQRNSNELQTRLPLIKEANVYVNKINEIVPIVAYISIRPKSVIDGTLAWLDMHGFPKAPIICRPQSIPTEYGSEWKARVLEKLYPKVQGIIDDNASILKFIRKDYNGTIFLYDHQIPIKGDVNTIHCKDWPAVYHNVKLHFNTPSNI